MIGQRIIWGWRRARHSAVALGALGTVTRIGSNLVLIPLMLFSLSTEEQAMWWILLAMGNFANLADFGFGQVISRAYSYLWAGAGAVEAEGLSQGSGNGTPNVPRLHELNATVRHLYLRLSIVAMGLLAIGGTWFLIHPIRAMALSPNIWWLWAGYLCVVGYSLASSHWLLAAHGVNRVRDMQLACIWGGIVYLLVAATLLASGTGLFALVFASAVRGWVVREVARRAYQAAVPPPVALVPYNFQVLRALWPNARKFGILSIGGYLLSNAMVLVSGRLLIDQTASIGLTNQVGVFATSLASIWLTVKWPELTMLRQQGRVEEMSTLFARRLSLTLGTMACIATVVVLLGNELLAWKGGRTRLLDTPYLLVYFLHLMHQLLYGSFGMLALTENVVPFFKVGLLTGIAVLALCLILTPLLGLWGLVLAPLVGEAAYSGWFTIRRGYRGQPLSIRKLLHAAATPFRS